MRPTGTVLRKTAAGSAEVQTRRHGLARKTFSLLLAVDGRRTLEQMCDTLSAYGDVAGQLAELQALGLIEAVVGGPQAAGADAAGDTRGAFTRTSAPTRAGPATRIDPPIGLSPSSRISPSTRVSPPTRTGPHTTTGPATTSGPRTTIGPQTTTGPQTTIGPRTTSGLQPPGGRSLPGEPRVSMPPASGTQSGAPEPAPPPATAGMPGADRASARIPAPPAHGVLGIADVPMPPGDGAGRPVARPDDAPPLAVRTAPDSFEEFRNLIDVHQYTTPARGAEATTLLREAMTASIGRSIDLDTIDLLESLERADSLAGLAALLPAYFAITAPRMGAAEHARHVEHLASLIDVPVTDFLAGRLVGDGKPRR